MYARPDITIEERMEIFSLCWRYQGDYGVVSGLAKEWKTSRRFIYDVVERVRQAMNWKRPGRPERDNRVEIELLEQRVRELESDCDELQAQLRIERENQKSNRLRLLLELALCPVSEEKIARCLQAAFSSSVQCSVGWISEQIKRAGEAALSVMQRDEVRGAMQEAALDEIFRHRQPILMLVEPHTLMTVVPEAAENRQGETWKQALLQYPNLNHVISDQGSGLIKGIELSNQQNQQANNRQMTHQYDLFHFKRELRRELKRLEHGCYEAMENVERARKLVNGRRMLSSAQVQALVEYRQKSQALDKQLEAFDWTEVIVDYLEENLSPFDERRGNLRSFKTAQAVVDEVLELLSEVKEVNTRETISIVEGARNGLFTFLQVLEEKLDQFQIKWHIVIGSRRALCNALACCWYWRSRANQSEKCQKKYILSLLNLAHWKRRVENLTEVEEKLCEALDQVVRASSAVECINSILRPYVSVKKHLTQGFLALIALYWNMHPLKQRDGKTPFELNRVDVGSDDWIEVLEIEMQKMVQTKQSVAKAA